MALVTRSRSSMQAFAAINLVVLESFILLLVCSRGTAIVSNYRSGIGRCRDGLFGDRCQFHCKCGRTQTKCLPYTSECRKKETCQRGWFGPGCQYRIADTDLPNWATDGKGETWNGTNSSEPIRARLAAPQTLSWLEISSSLIRGRRIEDIDTLQIGYVKEGSTKKITCPKYKGRTSRSKSGQEVRRRVFCPVDDLVSDVIIAGKGVRHLSSLTISAGRDVPVKELDYKTSKGTGISAADRYSIKRVTWHHMKDQLPCKTNFSEDFTLARLLDPAMPISMVYLYLYINTDKSVSAFENIEDYFQVIFWDSLFRRLEIPRKQTQLGPSHPNVLRIVSLSNLSRVSMITIDNLPRSDDFMLCKIEVYGDCPRGRYGAGCELACGCEDGGRCSPHGECIGECLPGFHGENCSKACDQGHYGPSCKIPCSPFCREVLCDGVTGKCNKGCTQYFHPPNCLSVEIPMGYPSDSRVFNQRNQREEKSRIDGPMAAAVAGIAVILFSASCLMNVVNLKEKKAEKQEAPQTVERIFLNNEDMAPYNLEHPFLSADDLAPEAQRHDTWGSNICDDGDEELSLGLSTAESLDWNIPTDITDDQRRSAESVI